VTTRRQFARWFATAVMGTAVAPRNWAKPGKPARPFKLSVMLWTLRPRYTAEQGIELAAAAGYDGFELVDEDKKWTSADVERIHARMTKLGIVCDAISGIDAGFAEPGTSQKMADELTARAVQAKRLDCHRIILLSGRRNPSIPREKQHAACIENLQAAADVAVKQNLELLIEPIDALENPSIYLTRVEEAFAIARAVNSPHVRVLYDVYHQQRGLPANSGLAPLLTPLQGNIDLLGLVHVADAPGRHAPGTGIIDYSAIYHALQRDGYRGWVAMEFLPVGDATMELRKAAEETSAAMKPSAL
jgi:hydroxypyruvate isomerase